MSGLREELKPTDALCHRWSREAWDWPPTNANPIYRGMRQREGAPQPGPPPKMSDEVSRLDRILARLDERDFLLVKVVYCQGGSMEQKAGRIGLADRRRIYERLNDVLREIRGALREHGVRV